jgi:uncharacterized protein YdeI (YjbR/CyaY-like superfamily)
VSHRHEWRQWLTENHTQATEIWLVYPRKSPDKSQLSYSDAVEEALCFGWIDGIAKKFDTESTAQRFTPRKSNSNWSSLNKERARRMIESGQMTEAGRDKLCDLSTDAFSVPDDVRDALKSEEGTWENFEQFPDYYQRIRVGYIEEVRNSPQEFSKRLAHLVKMTRKNKRFGTIR